MQTILAARQALAFIVLWMAKHPFSGSLNYTGFGGEGLQVRDVLHVDDLCDLLLQQLSELDRHSPQSPYNAGDGMENSVSLRELTEFCRDLVDNRNQLEPILR
jgi:CDP-paratose 2-epimerase